jgi:hypothetical protein
MTGLMWLASWEGAVVRVGRSGDWVVALDEIVPAQGTRPLHARRHRVADTRDRRASPDDGQLISNSLPSGSFIPTA